MFRICLGRCGWICAGIVALAVAIALPSCTSAPEKITVTPNPVLPKIEWERSTPPGPGGPLPDGWTPNEQQTLCFTSKGKQYCVSVCIARHSGTDCVYIKHGGCGTESGWILYCPGESSEDLIGLTSGSNCTTTVGTVSYNPLTGQADVDVTVACANWVDEDLIDVVIAHPSTPGTFLDSAIFRATYGNSMPAGSRVQFSGNAEETAWNTMLLKAELVEFETATGDEVVSAIVLAGNNLPPFAVTVINDQVTDVRVIHDPR